MTLASVPVTGGRWSPLVEDEIVVVFRWQVREACSRL